MSKFFEITAYFNNNICYIGEKKSYFTNEVLTEILNIEDDYCEQIVKELKRYLHQLCFKLDGSYDFVKNYHHAYIFSQQIFNEVKQIATYLPIYNSTLDIAKMDNEEIRHILNQFTHLFDYSYEKDTDKNTQKQKNDDNIDDNYEYEDDEPIAQLRRYKNDPYEFGNTHVLDDFTNYLNDFSYFRPKFNDGANVTVEKASSVELLNSELKDLFGEYIELLEDIVAVKKTYAPLLNEFIHHDRKFLTTTEVAEVFENYLSSNKYSTHLKPRGSMQLECRILRYRNKPIFCDTYTFDSLGAFLYFDFFRGLRSGYIPKKCDHCGRYFLLKAGRYAEFCNRPLKGHSTKTCRDIGAHKKYEDKCKGDPIWLAYNRAYKAHYARLLKKKMTKSEFLTWSNWAVTYRDEAIAGKVRISEYEKKIKE